MLNQKIDYVNMLGEVLHLIQQQSSSIDLNSHYLSFAFVVMSRMLLVVIFNVSLFWFYAKLD